MISRLLDEKKALLSQNRKLYDIMAESDVVNAILYYGGVLAESDASTKIIESALELFKASQDPIKDLKEWILSESYNSLRRITATMSWNPVARGISEHAQKGEFDALNAIRAIVFTKE